MMASSPPELNHYVQVQGRPEWTFMHVIVESSGSLLQLDAVPLKTAIKSAISSLFGEIGLATLDCDILHLDFPKHEFWLRVPLKDLNQVWAALSSVTVYEQRPCSFRVSKVSPHACLAVNDSRSFTDSLI